MSKRDKALLEAAETQASQPIAVESSIGCAPKLFQPTLQFKHDSSILGVSTVVCKLGHLKLRSGLLLRDKSSKPEQDLRGFPTEDSCTGQADADTAATDGVLKSTTSIDKGFYVPKSDGSHDFHRVDTYHLPSHAEWSSINPSYVEFVNKSMEEQTVDAIAIWLSEHYPEMGSDESGKNGDDNK